MIQAKAISKSYRKGFWMKSVQALRDVSLSVQEGDLYGFIGPNGAGKSTTIKSILGLVRPDEGELSVFGSNHLGAKERLQLGYMPEQPFFNDSLSGYEIVAYAGRLCGLSGLELDRAVLGAFEMVRANGDWIRRPLGQYSKGMQQRVGLAQAIVQKPKLLILDEPMSGLDPLGRRDLRQAMLDLNKEGTTIFFSSHVLSDVETLCNRVGMIVGGELRREGTLHELLGGEEVQLRIVVDTDQDLDFPQLRKQLNREWILDDAKLAVDLQRWLVEHGIGLLAWEHRKQGLEDLLGKEIAR